jgi:hypothetical protein
MLVWFTSKDGCICVYIWTDRCALRKMDARITFFFKSRLNWWIDTCRVHPSVRHWEHLSVFPSLLLSLICTFGNHEKEDDTLKNHYGYLTRPAHSILPDCMRNFGLSIAIWPIISKCVLIGSFYLRAYIVLFKLLKQDIYSNDNLYSKIQQKTLYNYAFLHYKTIALKNQALWISWSLPANKTVLNNIISPSSNHVHPKFQAYFWKNKGYTLIFILTRLLVTLSNNPPTVCYYITTFKSHLSAV